MALVQSSTPGGSGGSGATTAWQRDQFTRTTPWVSGLLLALTQVPQSEGGIFVWSQGLLLSSDDWNYVAGSNSIEILFSGDPAIDNPDTGTWTFEFQYPYTV